MAALQALALLAYPVLVYLALGFASPRAVALATLALLGIRLALFAPARFAATARAFAPAAVALGAASLVSLVWNDPLSLLLAPAVFSLALLATFAASFAARETTVERLAAAQVGDLDADERRYCRRVTALWCAFFAGNAAVSAAFALAGTREAWALYTGFIAYLLVGALFTAEYLYRHWRFRRYVGAATDPLLRRIFPPRT
jgi:uncharacterized membrane protein